MYICTFSRAHAQKYAHAENISLSFQAQLQPPPWSGQILTLEAVKLQTLSHEYERAAMRQDNSERI